MLHVGQTNNPEQWRFFFSFLRISQNPLTLPTATTFEFSWEKSTWENFPWGMVEMGLLRGALVEEWRKDVDVTWILSLNHDDFLFFFFFLEKSSLKTHSKKDKWLVILPVLPAFGELDPWEGLDNQNPPKKQRKKKVFPIFNSCTTFDDPRGEAPALGCLVFPQICCPSRKTKNKHAENHKDKFGCLCGKAWVLVIMRSQKKKKKR